MTATRFKVGDKVRVRKGLDLDRSYGEYLFISSMQGLVDKVNIITGIHNDGDAYLLNHRDEGWTDEMLELVPIKKTLKNMEKGDVVVDQLDYPRTVLLAIDGCYLLSAVAKPTVASCWRTAEELRVSGCTVQQPTPTKIETIEINGKKYNEAEVERAIEHLSPIDPSDTDS